MTVVHVNTEWAWGGGEVQTCCLIRGLEALGIENVLVAQPGSQIALQMTDEGAKVAPLRMRGECDVLAIVRLSSMLRQMNPDVLHLHTSHAHTLGWLAGRLAHVKRIVVTRRMDHDINGIFSWVKYRRVDHIVAISEVIGRTLSRSGLSPEKLSMIYSAVACSETYPQGDLRSVYGFGPDIPVVGTVATLARQKGHAHIFEAIRIVKQRYPQIRLLVAGTGPLEKRLRKLAKKLDLADAIVFAGFRRDIPQVLNTLNLFVLASQDEGLGVSLLEAACRGLPIIATDVGGIPEIVEDGTTGLLVPPRDGQALAEKMLDLLDHPEKAETLGRNARALVRERFSLETMVQRYCALYRQLLDGKRCS